jgi:hypothetical protein
MSLSRTWYTDANYVASDVTTAAKLSHSILFALKAFLMGQITGTNGPDGAPPSGARWTCTKSCAFVSGAQTVSLVADLFSSTFVDTEWVRATAGTNHSWFVLTSPAALGPVYMLVDMSTSADTTVTVRFSYTDFSTGGTITAAPTSANSWVYGPDATTSSVSVNFNDGSTGAHKIHRSMDANGNFWFLTSKNGAGFFYWLVGFQQLVETRTGETKSGFSFLNYNAGGRGAGSISTSANAMGYFNSGNGRTSNNNSLVVGGRTYDNTTNFVGGILTVAYSINNNGGTNTTSPLGETTQGFVNQTNSADSKWDFFPIWIYTNIAGNSGTRGRIPDVSACTSGPAVGAGAPSAASQDRVVAGNIVIPFSVAPSL